MIVLDEQLLGRRLEEIIAQWYPGTVCYITDLRPHSVIKDDAIPELLRQQNEPTFVTINEKDFWRKVPIDSHYCVVCFTCRIPAFRRFHQYYAHSCSKLNSTQKRDAWGSLFVLVTKAYTTIPPKTQQ